MRPVRIVGVYLLVVFLGGALIAPWVYRLVQAADRVLPGLHSLAVRPFPRYVNRCLTVLAIAGLWPILRATGLNSWRAMGLGQRPGAGAQVTWGFLLGLASLAGILILAISSGARTLDHSHSATRLLLRLVTAGLSAICLAPLEEIAFRGALFGALRKTFHWIVALALSSIVYAVSHFLVRPGTVDYVDWSSGLVVLAGNFSQRADLMPSLLNLILVGMILGLAYQRSGSLYFSIGLHAGWIFWLKTYGFLTDEAAPNQSWFYGTSALINGWLAALILGTVLIVLSGCMIYNRPETDWKERGLLS